MNKLITLQAFNGDIERKVLETEKELGISLHLDYKNIVLNYNVSKPRNNFYKKDKVIFTLDYFFGFSTNKYEDFQENYKTYKGRMSEDLYPIGSVDGGDLLCINKTSGKVYYWFHEEDDWGLRSGQPSGRSSILWLPSS